ncbi:MAG: DUF1614 domain-containing protein [Limisphaerales bacterium]
MNYVPLTWAFFGLLWFVFAMVVVLAEIGLLRYVFETLGVSQRYMLLLLVCSLLGSYVNIPVATLPPEYIRSGEIVRVFGMSYVVPVVREWPGTVLAVNLGGAVIPVVLSIYLIFKSGEFFNCFLAVVMVSFLVHRMARPVQGVGIVVPTFIPPLVTAVIALLLSRRHAPAVAYVSGSIGTLVGADLLNLKRVIGMGAPIASIGGAGKFDGIFLTGIVAMLLAGIIGGYRHRASLES